MGNRLLLGFAAIACSACVSNTLVRTIGDDNGSLERFDDVCTFLPEGMQSYWLSDWSHHQVDGTPHERHLIARAARNFQSPPFIGAAGTDESVEATDFGPGGQAVYQQQEDTRWKAIPAIQGHPSWHSPAEFADEQPLWLAIVDARYEVRATSHELLTQALRRTGNRKDLLGFVPDLHVLTPKASDMIFCRARPQPTTPYAGPSPTTVMVAQLVPKTRRLEVFANMRQPLLEDYYERPGHCKVIGRSTHSNYNYFVVEFSEPNSWVLSLMLLFGRHIAI